MFNDFSQRMELAREDRKRLLTWVKSGAIIELGCGNGSLLNLVSNHFPESIIVGVDKNKKRIADASANVPDANLFLCDILGARNQDFFRKKYSTVLMNAVFHEIESELGNSASLDAFQIAYELLAPGGVFVFRDGVKPINANEICEVEFLSEYACKKFERFFMDFTERNVWHKRERKETFRINMKFYDLHDALNKYYFEDELWAHDMSETFGRMNKNEYIALFSSKFEICHAETYTAEYLARIWEKDLNVVGRDYPHSHIVIVGEKK